MNRGKPEKIDTERLELKISQYNEQKRLWEILTIDDVNKYLIETEEKIFKENNLDKKNINDVKKERELFLEELKDWKKQEDKIIDKVFKTMLQDNKCKYTWSIFIKGTDKVIGEISSPQIEGKPDYIRGLRIYIDPEYQKKGYAEEAVKSVLEYMFEKIEVEEIKTNVVEKNTKAINLIEKLGFKKNGEKETSYIEKNKFLKAKEYSMNKDLYLENYNAKINEKMILTEKQVEQLKSNTIVLDTIIEQEYNEKTIRLEFTVYYNTGKGIYPAYKNQENREFASTIRKKSFEKYKKIFRTDIDQNYIIDSTENIVVDNEAKRIEFIKALVSFANELNNPVFLQIDEDYYFINGAKLIEEKKEEEQIKEIDNFIKNNIYGKKYGIFKRNGNFFNMLNEIKYKPKR